MKQLNNKGFTLIELLATIVIIGLVIGLSTFGIIKVVNNSKDQSAVISENNIKEAAKIYSTEKNNDDSYWLDIADQEYKYFCVTIQELINKGLLDKKATLDSKFQSTDYVAIKKNKVTMVSSNSEILSKDVDQNDEDIKTMIGVCGGSIINEKVNKIPKLNDETSWTDQIDIPFDDAEAESSITDRKCWYGTTTGNLSKEGEVEGKTCKIASNDGKLKDSTYYYVRICMTTERNSKICSDTESYVTKNLISPIIDVNNNVTITYKDDNIKGEAGHYFKSTLDGTSTSNVQKCDNNFNCEESSTTSITKDTWYKTNNNSVTLTYQNSGDGTVTARITDRSNNYLESSKDISIYKVTFNKGTADKIDGTTSDVSKLCVAETGKTCTIKSPSITKANYTVIGWNTNSSAKTSSWNVGVEKNISNNSTYYPIVRINKVYIRFNTNGGTVTGETTTASGNIYKWKTDSNGLISRTNANGSKYSTDFFSIKYGSETGSDGLTNYNNSKYLKITKTGYSAVSGSEWICQSGCTTSGKTFSQTSVYSASDFCDASTKDCTVVLGVNWRINKVYIKLKPNGGTNASTNTNYGINGNGYITYKGSDIIHTINYGGKMTTDGLLNYNNSSYLNIKKTGYNAVFEKEWICSSGCVSGRTFNQAYQYSASDFCDASTKDCTVVLGVNWQTNTYTVTYDANGGSGAPSAQTKTYGTDLILSSTKPTRTDYTFQGWATSSSATSATYQPGSTYTTNANLTLYAVWNSYICSYNNKRYATFEEAKAACTITDIQDMEAVESTTYSCPAGYTCSDGTCTSSSKCEKTVTGEISEMYYCPHNNSYQTSETCSYTGWENAAFDLGCSTTKTCSDPTYTCPSGSSLSGTKCYKYDRYSCPSGWTAVKTGYCEYSCAKGNVLLYAKCSGFGTCKSDSAYSCVSTCGSNDDQHCRANIPLYGSNYPYTSCKTTNTIYNCYTPATKKENCVTTGQYYAGNYRGCRLVGSDKVTNGFSCSSGNTGNYNDVGTSSCAISGYTLTKSLDGDCPDELKFDKDGTKYCDTANDYWKGKSCTSGYQYGASAIYKLTCSKNGTLKYYCDITDTYSTSQPSSCSKKVSEDVISTVVTNYVCPIGYNPSDNDDTCYKTVVYEVQ